MASDQEPKVTKLRELTSPLVLNLEMEAPEPGILTLFRESFLAWLRDRSASRFSRDAGVPVHVAMEETGADADRASKLRLTVSWSQESPRAAEGLVAAAESERFKFFEDTQPQPLVHLEPALDDAEIAAALRYAELMRRRPRPVTRKLASKAVILATQSRRHASRVFQAGLAMAARYLPAARRLAAKAAVLATRSMHAVRGVGSMAVLRFRVRLATAQSSLAALAARVQPSSASLRIPAVLAAVSVLLVLGTTAFVLRGGGASHDRVSGSAVAVQPVAGSSARPAVEQKRPEEARADTPRPQKDAQNTPVAAQAPTVQAPTVKTPPVQARTVQGAPAFKAVPRAAAIRRTAALPPAHRVKVRERRPADTRHTTVGTLQVGSEPSGAEVFVNGVSQGRTPLTLRGLPSGSRVVRLDMPGYARWSWSVAVVANKRTPLSVKLQPDTRRAGVAGDPMDFARVP